jgi:hypothetical protein
MSDFQLKTAVVLIIFNRPHTTDQVFAEIAHARPPKLLVVSDGSRTNREGEARKVASARSIISRVNWPCEVFTNFSEKNLGSKLRPKTGIDWAFELVDEAIILEDDCLPHPTFFRFCEELLARYRNDQRVSMISGNRFQSEISNFHESYFFSKYHGTWGWATWRDRWSSYDIEMKNWPFIRDSGALTNILTSKEESAYWSGIFESIYSGNLNTAWDYQWTLSQWIQNRLCIMPRVNLVSNIGFGDGATHTLQTESNLANIPVNEIPFPLNHPANMLIDLKTEKKIFEFCHSYNPSLWERIIRKFRNGINYIA